VSGAFTGEAKARCRRRMERVDAMSPELRACVHEYGLTIVDAFVDIGVTKARHIRHLVETVRKGSVEIGNRTGLPPTQIWQAGRSQ
jgi:hypothetical protein